MIGVWLWLCGGRLCVRWLQAHTVSTEAPTQEAGLASMCSGSYLI